MSRFFTRRKGGRSTFVRAIHSHGQGHRDAHGKDNRGPAKFIAKAESLIKKRIHSNVGVPNASASAVTKALKVLERIGLDPNNPVRLKSLVDDMLSQSNRIQQRSDDLFRLDKALCRLDLKWLNRIHGFRVTRLTLAQRTIMQENITEERRRTRIKGSSERLELQITLHLTAMDDSIRNAKQCLEQEDMPGAAGWLYKTLLERERAPQLLEAIRNIEQRLLDLLTREKKELLSQ
jgi:hypothetical protein